MVAAAQVVHYCAGACGIAGWMLSLVALNYQRTYVPFGSMMIKLHNLWQITIGETYNSSTTLTPQVQTAGAAVFIVVLLGLPIGLFSVGVGNAVEKGKGSVSAMSLKMAAAYFFLFFMTCLYWIYRVDNNMELGPYLDVSAMPSTLHLLTGTSATGNPYPDTFIISAEVVYFCAIFLSCLAIAVPSAGAGASKNVEVDGSRA
jgi:hypothetical protein